MTRYMGPVEIHTMLFLHHTKNKGRDWRPKDIAWYLPSHIFGGSNKNWGRVTAIALRRLKEKGLVEVTHHTGNRVYYRLSPLGEAYCSLIAERMKAEGIQSPFRNLDSELDFEEFFKQYLLKEIAKMKAQEEAKSVEAFPL